MAAARQIVVGGVGASLGLEDVVRVARGELAVVLDTAACERIKKESPPPRRTDGSEPDASTSAAPEREAGANGSDNTGGGGALTLEQLRAALLARLLPLINGRSKVRLGVVQLLSRWIASAPQCRSVPMADTNAEVLTQLAGALTDLPEADGGGGDVGVSAPTSAEQAVLASGLSGDERAVFLTGQPVTAGIGALFVHDGRRLMALAASAAALSAEALQAQTAAFEPELAEAQPHKASMAVASDLTGLLEGSSRVSPRRGGAGYLHELSAVSQVHGAANEALDSAAAAVKAELAAKALAPGKAAAALTPSPALPLSLVAAARWLLALARLSMQRTTRLLMESELAPFEGVPLQPPNTSAMDWEFYVAWAAIDEWQPPSVKAARAAAAVLAAVSAQLSDEAFLAAALLRIQEVASAAFSSDGPAGGGASKKKGKANAGFVLGRGSALFRSLVEGAAAGLEADAADANADVIARFTALSTADAAPDARARALQRVRTALSPACARFASFLAALRAALEANQTRRKPKIAKGARDLLPDQMRIRDVAFGKIKAAFARHGAVAIDTPVFELRETLTGKYGEDSKLIFDLADQGGEALSLRYDLTVPFARYVALNGVSSIKRYHIAKVYRRDNPQMNRGRFREFYQCDFDIAGTYPTMVPDAEVIKVTTEILDDLGIGSYTIKLNHRRLLDAMLDIAGVPAQKFRAICSAIDKLDKASWAEVREEMVAEKGLPPDVADRIGEYVVLSGRPQELLARLTAPGFPLAEHPDSKAALEELRLLFGFLEVMGALGPVSFDLSLARGLDYYTGVIYEAVLEGANVGSIAAGGRYDKLVGMFSGKDVPAVGISIGIERVFKILQDQMEAEAQASGGFIRSTATDVLVASIGKGLQRQRMQVASQLWEAGIAAEFGFKADQNMKDQLKYAFDSGIRFMVLFGEEEINSGTVKLKDLDANEQMEVPLADIASAVQSKLDAAGDRGIIAAGRASE